MKYKYRKKKDHRWKKCKVCGKEIYVTSRRKTCGGKCALKYAYYRNKY